MRKYLFVALVVALSAGTIAAYASVGPITRTGSAYSGYANPGGCEVEVENGTELHVNCSHSEKAARIRFRFLKDVGFVRGPATISADLHIIKGSCTVAWMVPQVRTPARTARVRVSAGSYCHVRSLTATQP